MGPLFERTCSAIRTLLHKKGGVPVPRVVQQLELADPVRSIFPERLVWRVLTLLLEVSCPARDELGRAANAAGDAGVGVSRSLVASEPRTYGRSRPFGCK